MGKIKVVIKRPDEEVGHITWISNTLENLQRTVGGYIETVTFGDLVIICDEEGRLKGKEHNCRIENVDFVGTIIGVGSEGDSFSDVPLSMSGWKSLIR